MQWVNRIGNTDEEILAAQEYAKTLPPASCYPIGPIKEMVAGGTTDQKEAAEAVVGLLQEMEESLLGAAVLCVEHLDNHPESNHLRCELGKAIISGAKAPGMLLELGNEYNRGGPGAAIDHLLQSDKLNVGLGHHLSVSAQAVVLQYQYGIQRRRIVDLELQVADLKELLGQGDIGEPPHVDIGSKS